MSTTGAASVTRTRSRGLSAGRVEGTVAEALLLLLARLLVGVIFLIAGVAKIGTAAGFAETIRAYHLLPEPFVVPFALILPWLEVLAAAYLVVGFLSRIGAWASIAMLAMFVFALGHALLTGNAAHACGCFGAEASPVLKLLAGGDTIGWWDVIRDVILIALAALVAWRGAGPWSVDALLRRRASE